MCQVKIYRPISYFFFSNVLIWKWRKKIQIFLHLYMELKSISTNSHPLWLSAPLVIYMWTSPTGIKGGRAWVVVLFPEWRYYMTPSSKLVISSPMLVIKRELWTNHKFRSYTVYAKWKSIDPFLIFVIQCSFIEIKKNNYLIFFISIDGTEAPSH